jgi:hypothetical protein
MNAAASARLDTSELEEFVWHAPNIPLMTGQLMLASVMLATTSWESSSSNFLISLKIPVVHLPAIQDMSIQVTDLHLGLVPQPLSLPSVIMMHQALTQTE